jgi:hypothetical protein
VGTTASYSTLLSHVRDIRDLYRDDNVDAEISYPKKDGWVGSLLHFLNVPNRVRIGMPVQFGHKHAFWIDLKILRGAV